MLGDVEKPIKLEATQAEDTKPGQQQKNCYRRFKKKKSSPPNKPYTPYKPKFTGNTPEISTVIFDVGSSNQGDFFNKNCQNMMQEHAKNRAISALPSTQ